MMKRINEQRRIKTIHAWLCRWLYANPENRHLISAPRLIKGEFACGRSPDEKPIRMVQQTLFS